jgi:hypothetical protein
MIPQIDYFLIFNVLYDVIESVSLLQYLLEDCAHEEENDTRTSKVEK